MRAGTQTLIQALQAVPWDSDRGEEDTTAPEDTSDEEGAQGGERGTSECARMPDFATHTHQPVLDFVLASSIHTIHRPVVQARSPVASKIFNLSDPPTDEYFATLAEEGAEADFEPEHQGAAAELVPISPVHTITSIRSAGRRDGEVDPRENQLRKPSMATVRLRRRARLAEKLREVFELKDIDEVVAGELVI